MSQKTRIKFFAGSLLRHIRKDLGYSLTYVGNRVNISVQHMCDVESGRRRLDLTKAAILDEFLRLKEFVLTKAVLNDLLRASDLALEVKEVFLLGEDNYN